MIIIVGDVEVDVVDDDNEKKKDEDSKPEPETVGGGGGGGEAWSIEEKNTLFMFVSKLFLMNFPLYMAYKHIVHPTVEELSQQEATALNNYCEVTVSYRSFSQNF